MSITLKPSPRKIMAQVAAEFGITVDDILRNDRATRFAWPRREAMHRVRETYPKASSAWIAQHFERDHTTVLHALRQAVPTRKPYAGRPVPQYPLLARLLRAELVRILHAEGWERHDICNAVNLSLKQIWEILNRGLAIEDRPVPEVIRRLPDLKEAA